MLPAFGGLDRRSIFPALSSRFCTLNRMVWGHEVFSNGYDQKGPKSFCGHRDVSPGVTSQSLRHLNLPVWPLRLDLRSAQTPFPLLDHQEIRVRECQVGAQSGEVHTTTSDAAIGIIVEFASVLFVDDAIAAVGGSPVELEAKAPEVSVPGTVKALKMAFSRRMASAATLKSLILSTFVVALSADLKSNRSPPSPPVSVSLPP
ncbi:hypothetical protein QO002_005816 [Pararhizobium capsulatum DSM 1112]|uniref:Uncharacterized protein n=1 Tax=Pararhizobium capsulatum DSM 1112 TaxID=1121113 RepID=A0ABU0BZB5_9HYPH|nr:hypothetical protein [Pararhizobium capsulatum]MDQ0323610.1 hypothetical protein [Pararhizobium capsulatum DSM 1112]